VRRSGGLPCSTPATSHQRERRGGMRAQSLLILLFPIAAKASLEAQLQAQAQQLAAQEQQLAMLKARMQSLEAAVMGSQGAAAPGHGLSSRRLESWTTSPTGEGRRLSSVSQCCRWTPSGACAVNETRSCTELHEYLEDKTTTHTFADSSSCPGDGATPSFHGDTGEVVISSGGIEVSRVPTPLKVHHAEDCSGATMELQLNTSVQRLTVAGIDVGSTLAAPTWSALTLASGMTTPQCGGCPNNGYTAMYAIIAGIVHLRGAIGGTGDYSLGSGTITLATLPAEATPSVQRITLGVAYPEGGSDTPGHSARINVETNGNVKYLGQGRDATSCYLDGISYAL